jgi:hypothetical protein
VPLLLCPEGRTVASCDVNFRGKKIPIVCPLAPRQMVVDEIETFRHLARTDRGCYSAGQNAGKPFPPHPVKILGVGPIRRDEMVPVPSVPERPKIEA